MSPSPPSIGFGLERLAQAPLARPRAALALVLALTLLAAVGASRIEHGDDPGALLHPPGHAAAMPFLDPADLAVVLVEAEDLSRQDRWQAFAALVAQLEARLGADRVASVLDLIDLEKAVALPADPFADPPDRGDPDREDSDREDPGPAALAGHPLAGPLLAPDLGSAAILLAPDPDLAPLASTRAIQAALRAALAEAPAPGLDVTLTGLPTARAEVVRRMAVEQPALLGAGLAIGLVLGAVLLGRVADALVIAVMPVLSILWSFGALGWSATPLTPLTNNLPLLVLALAFTASMHLVFAARHDLHAAGGAFAALRGTWARIAPAVALSMLTTALAFLSLGLSGSAAVAGFGLIGALAVLGVLLAALLVQPVVLWAALGLGWRPRPARQGPQQEPGAIARALEAAGVRLGRGIHRFRRGVAGASLAAALGSGAAFLALEPEYDPRNAVPPGSATAADLDRLAGTFGARGITLPLPMGLGTGADIATLRGLRVAHEAAAQALPGARVFSPHSVLGWLAEAGGVSPGRLEAALGAMPDALGALVLSEGGEAALVATLAPGQDPAAAAARLEQAVGAALGVDLAGQARGLAVAAARQGPGVVAGAGLGLAAAAVGAAGLVALAFRSAAVLGLALLPNLLPVLSVGAALWALGRPLDLTATLAMTVALGIGVDDTVHLLAAYRHHRGRRGARAALVHALRRLLPVLAVTTAVLSMGLAPALWAWSPSISLFAAFAILTLVAALAVDLVALPALIACREAR